MGSHVSGKMSFLGAGVVTVYALEWTLTSVGPDVLYVVIFAVRKIRALVASEKLARKMIPQMFLPMILTDGGISTNGALEYSLVFTLLSMMFKVCHVVVVAVGVVSTALTADHAFGVTQTFTILWVWRLRLA